VVRAYFENVARDIGTGGGPIDAELPGEPLARATGGEATASGLPHDREERLRLAKRPDLAAIAAWVRPDTSVLDLGCGDGLLLKHLRETRNVRGYGIEIEDEKVIASVANGVNVLQGNLEGGLAGFDSGSFDYVILS